MKKIILIIGLLFSVIVAKDLNLKELETNCNDGDIESCSDIGFLYLQGEGVKQDYQKAAELFKKACDGSSRSDCFILANLYRDGKGVEQNYQKAAKLYQKSCNNGEMYSCNFLGKLYATGKGVRQDYQKAFKLYQEEHSIKNISVDKITNIPGHGIKATINKKEYLLFNQLRFTIAKLKNL